MSTPLDPLRVSAEMQPHLRLYRRLWLSLMDLDEAKAAIDEILASNLKVSSRKLPSALHLSLTTAVVVAYARPFVNSRGQSVIAERTVPGSLLRVLTSRERELHEIVIDIRNREVAHSDADIVELSIILHPGGHGAIYRSTRNPFGRAELRTLRRIVEKLEREITRRCEELRTILPGNAWL